MNKLRQKFIIVISFLFAVNSLPAQEVNRKDDQGRKQGSWVAFYEGTTDVKYQGEFKNDIPVGKFIFFYENGKVRAKNTYQNNGKDSYVSMYHENGKLMSMGKYVDEKRDSIWVFLDEHGNYLSKENYKAGKRHGKCITFYAFNPRIDAGQPDLLEVALYVNGEKEGEYLKYYRNGKYMMQGNYSSGVLEGKRTTFYSTGKKRTEVHFKKGVKNGYTINYDGNEVVTSKEYYKNGYELKGKVLEDYLKRKKEISKN